MSWMMKCAIPATEIAARFSRKIRELIRHPAHLRSLPSFNTKREDANVADMVRRLRNLHFNRCRESREAKEGA